MNQKLLDDAKAAGFLIYESGEIFESTGGWNITKELAKFADLQHNFQVQVNNWMLTCFGGLISSDKIERNFRFFEESTEAVQSSGMTREQCHALVDYTFDRPIGEFKQEIGGVMVTLAAMCNAHGLDALKEGQTELARIIKPDIMAKIRAKQAAKPKNVANSPLPSPPINTEDK